MRDIYSISPEIRFVNSFITICKADALFAIIKITPVILIYQLFSLVFSRILNTSRKRNETRESEKNREIRREIPRKRGIFEIYPKNPLTKLGKACIISNVA